MTRSARPPASNKASTPQPTVESKRGKLKSYPQFNSLTNSIESTKRNPALRGDISNTDPQLFESTRIEALVQRSTFELANKLADLELSHQQLLKDKQLAEQANDLKTRFLASASHDVLQPLNAAMLLISTLSSLQGREEGVQICRQVERSLETMHTLLRDLLFMSRLDAGGINPYWQSVSLDALFESIASDFQPIAEVRNLELRVKYSGIHVRSDPTMLRRTIQNIVANALRYTQTGGALLIANKCREHVRIRIADTGIGISDERLNEVFKEFYGCDQVASGFDNSSSGLGLGLAIVARMSKALDINLTLNSTVGRGTCFCLNLPLDKTYKQPTKTNNTTHQFREKSVITRFDKTRILVIDNEYSSLQAMGTLLHQWGCQLRLTTSVDEARSALNSKSDWSPDIIIANPLVDKDQQGLALIHTLRQSSDHLVPVILVTSDPSQILQHQVKQNDLQVLQAPVKPAHLRALISHLRSRSALSAIDVAKDANNTIN